MTTDGSASPAEQGDGGSQNDTPSRLGAPKDRKCPFCGIPFTSSSLGRHLDLYIKDRNPKPPDGVHDVNKIRQIRGKITRRHPKGFSAKQQQQAMEGQDSEHSPGQQHGPSETRLRAALREAGDTHSPYDGPFADTINGPSLLNPSNPRLSLHKMNWQATGVINDLPNKADRPGYGMQGYAGERPALARSDTEPAEGSASVEEVALRDVMKNLQRAAARVQRPGPFDYDLFSLNFPALCLKLLPTPPTLFSTTPSHSNTSWPINPPNEGHLELVKAAIRRRIKGFMQVCPPLDIRMAETREECDKHLADAVEQEMGRYQDHCNCVHAQWQELSEDQQQQVWHLEVMRALSKTFSDLSAMSMRLARAQDQVEELRDDKQRLLAVLRSKEQGKRLNVAPYVSQAVIQEMANIDSDPEAWTYQVLLDRYRDTLPGPFDSVGPRANGCRSRDDAIHPAIRNVDADMDVDDGDRQ